MKTANILITATLIVSVCAPTANSQTTQPPPTQQPRRVVVERRVNVQGAKKPESVEPPENFDAVLAPAIDMDMAFEPLTFNFVSSEMSFDNKPVKGAPYSAEAVTETIQTLADGNRIVRRNASNIYRDGEGRTRREQTFPAFGFFTANNNATKDSAKRVTTFINDPIAGVNYVLDERTRTARKHPNVRFDFGGMNDSIYETMKRVQKDLEKSGKEMGKAHKEMNKAHKEMQRQLGVLDKNVIIMRGEPGDAPPVPPVPPTSPVPSVAPVPPVAHPIDDNYMVNALSFERFSERANTKKENLGKQTFDGVEAEGTRRTVTIPTGEIGNERPIEIVSERWYAPSLQVVVMTKRSDPRSGETTYRLTNINRNEPSRTLFEVPADYTIKETTAPNFNFRVQKRVKEKEKSNEEK